MQSPTSNRSRSDPASVTPTPDEIREWRRVRELSAAQAAALVHSTGRVWQQWEAGERRMHPAFWELARSKRRFTAADDRFAWQGRLRSAKGQGSFIDLQVRKRQALLAEIERLRSEIEVLRERLGEPAIE